MSLIRKAGGFTLMEIVLAIIVIGVLAAVIVPRAMRARVQAKYSILQQTCVELASYGNEWATYQLESQFPARDATTPEATIKDYLDSLSNGVNGAWIANPAFNWAGNTLLINDRIDPNTGVGDAPPSASVMERLPPAPGLRNPFSGLSVFSPENDPEHVGEPVAGAIACGSQLLETRPGGEQIFYYAFVYQGTDSTAVSFASEDTFHAGQGIDSLAGLRNGVFFATAGTMGGP